MILVFFNFGANVALTPNNSNGRDEYLHIYYFGILNPCHKWLFKCKYRYHRGGGEARKKLLPQTQKTQKKRISRNGAKTQKR